jgi:hypothetical protein
MVQIPRRGLPPSPAAFGLFYIILLFYIIFSSEEEEGTSNEMLYGSLMCISLSKVFDSLIWATVVNSEVQRNGNM